MGLEFLAGMLVGPLTYLFGYSAMWIAFHLNKIFQT